jgi:hypothetical protein
MKSSNLLQHGTHELRAASGSSGERNGIIAGQNITWGNVPARMQGSLLPQLPHPGWNRKGQPIDAQSRKERRRNDGNLPRGRDKSRHKLDTVSSMLHSSCIDDMPNQYLPSSQAINLSNATFTLDHSLPPLQANQTGQDDDGRNDGQQSTTYSPGRLLFIEK